jgi:hypothetical protein
MKRAAGPVAVGGQPGTGARPGGDVSELDELRHHWGSAYDIGFERDRWIAQRRDGKGQPLTDPQPGGLRDKIAADYLADPVPRDLP